MNDTSLTPQDRALFARVATRIIPLMILMYAIAFLDRSNLAFAALEMNEDLGFSPEVYGFGAGIFFIGYFLFEVPSNVIIEKVGARIWICRIMITWGLVSGAMAFVQGTASFYTLRFLLGVAEAGFAPGMLLYMTYWFPAELRAKYLGLYLVAIPLANMIGAPLSSWLLGFDGIMGLHGWQWLFIIEAMPALIVGVAVLWLLPDGPGKTRWLSSAEKERIAFLLSRERMGAGARSHSHLWPALQDSRVLLMCGIYVCITIGIYGINMWLPTMTKSMGFSLQQVGLIVAFVYLLSAIALPIWGLSSDRSQERIAHVAIPCFAAAAGFAASGYFVSPDLVIASLALAGIGVLALLPPFWALPPRFLAGTAAAGGIALINATGNLGGFIGPYLVGWIKGSTQGFTTGMLALAFFMGLAGALMLLFRSDLLRQEAR